MTDSRSGYDEDSLPWLQEVEDQDDSHGISARAMLIGLLAVALAAALVAGGFFWLGRKDVAAGGTAELIKAPAAPYKVKPADPGGLDIAGESQTTYETSAGEDVDSRLNLGAAGADVPKGAVEAPPQPRSEADTPAPAEKPAPAPAPEPRPSGATGSVVQLGAFANQAQAERAWTALSSRFPSVAALDKRIVPFPGGIRLRAGASSPARAREVCDALKAAGEACFIAR